MGKQCDSNTNKPELFLLELKIKGPQCMHCNLIFSPNVVHLMKIYEAEVSRDSVVGIDTTCWTTQGSNPGEGEFSAPVQTLGPIPSPVQWVPGHSRGVKRPGRGVNDPPHVALRLKKECSSICTPPVRLHGVNFTFVRGRECGNAT